MSIVTGVEQPVVFAPRVVPIPGNVEIILPESRWFVAARALLLFILFASPLAFGAVQPLAWSTITVFAVLVVCCWAFACVREQQITFMRTLLYAPLVLFGLLAAAQLWSHRTWDPIATRDSLTSYCTYAILFAMAGTLFGKASAAVWLRFGQIISIYTGALALFGILQFFSSPGAIYWTIVPRWGGAIFGPYVNRDHYAGLMELLLPLTAVTWATNSRHGLWNGLSGLATLIGLASVALCGSRAGTVSILLEMLVLGVLLLCRQNRTGARNSISFLGTGFLALTLLLAWLVPEDVIVRFESAVHSPEVSTADRISMTRDSLHIFRSHLWTGTGMGSLETVYPQYQTFVSDLRVTHAHDDYAEALAETGVAGGVLLAAALAIFFIRVWKNARSILAMPPETAPWLRIGAALGCCGILLHSAFDFNLHIPANAAWFAVCAGLAVSSQSKKTAFKDRFVSVHDLSPWQSGSRIPPQHA